MPKRVQRRRTKGWRQAAGVVYVGRPSKWGNPHRIGAHSRAEAVSLFRADLVDRRLAVNADDVRRELRGKDLACWCPLDQPCHADVLLELANQD
jgi:hypothetical protein